MEISHFPASPSSTSLPLPAHGCAHPEPAPLQPLLRYPTHSGLSHPLLPDPLAPRFEGHTRIGHPHRVLAAVTHRPSCPPQSLQTAVLAPNRCCPTCADFCFNFKFFLIKYFFFWRRGMRDLSSTPPTVKAGFKAPTSQLLWSRPPLLQ